jgi:predicted unusual protein kinase regulating ubiquinone biosynthesis (AarF/ABC1/UbiB family)
LKLEGEFVNVAVGIALVEGIGKRLDPSQDLLKASIPFLKQAVYRRIKGDVSRNEDSLVKYVMAWCKNKINFT